MAHDERPPAFPLARIFAVRDRCVAASQPWVGKEIAGAEFAALVRALAEELRAPDNAVRDSLLLLAGRTATQVALYAVSWRLAALARQVKRGRAAPPWTRQADLEWVAAQVVSVTPRPGDRPGATLRVRFLSGSPAALVSSGFLSLRACDVVAGRLGFTRFRGQFPYTRPVELTNMRFAALLDPERSRSLPWFSTVAATPSLLSWNREILRKRMRINWECPRRYRHNCYACHVPYQECPAGVINARDT